MAVIISDGAKLYDTSKKKLRPKTTVMKTFHIKNFHMKTFRFFRNPALVAIAVAAASVIAGAGAMAAIAGNPEPSSAPEAGYSSSSRGSGYRKATKKKQSKKTNRDEDTGKYDVLRLAVHDFTSIDISGVINVVFTQGESDGFIECHGERTDLDRIRISYSGNTLKIGYDSGIKRYDTYSIRTILYITNPWLDGISASGASSFTAHGLLNTAHLTAETSGASNINIPKISGNTLELSASGASKIDVLSAEMNDITAEASGASVINMKGICAREVDCEASGVASVSATGRCNKKNSTGSLTATVEDRGLIIENNLLNCGNSGKKKTMPRKP